MKTFRRQHGFSLVELMVSITLGILLVFGVVEVYTGSKQTYRTQDALARLQENARFAIDVIARDIRMAGSMGCKSVDQLTPAALTAVDLTAGGTQAFNYDEDGALSGVHRSGSGATDFQGAFPPNLANTGVADATDVLWVQGAGQCSTTLTSDMLAGNPREVQVDDGVCDFRDENVALVANCTTANVFRIDGTPSVAADVATITANADLSELYTQDSGTEVMTFYSNVYFIREDNGIPSLFVIDNTAINPNAVALVEGVENMQIEYGLDLAGDDGIPDRFVDVIGVGENWSDVVVVRLSLLMRTIEQLGAQATTFDVGYDPNLAYAGGPIRQTFVSTIKLRNRSL